MPVEALTIRHNLRYLESLRGLARRGRCGSTRTEDILWYEVLNKRRLGYKFTRQKPIGKFIADFYCAELLLIVEVDGGYHLKNKYYDKERDLYLETLNIGTVRINTLTIVNELRNARKILEDVIQERSGFLKCSPSSRGGGRRPEGFWFGGIIDNRFLFVWLYIKGGEVLYEKFKNQIIEGGWSDWTKKYQRSFKSDLWCICKVKCSPSSRGGGRRPEGFRQQRSQNTRLAAGI